MQQDPEIAIIGGGAGGLVAAIAAAEEAAVLGRRVGVHIYEATDKVGRPILASGNGRCNFSNSRIDVSAYRNAEFAGKCLGNIDSIFNRESTSQSFPNGVVAWFASHGLMYAEEGEGRLYPRANKSSSVLDVLRLSLDRLGVQIHLDSKVEFIDAAREGAAHVTMRMADGAFERADKAIVACGGSVGRHLLPDGSLSFKGTTPVLCPIEVDGSGKKVARRLENIRVKCALSLIREGRPVGEERGEAMFRKYGISGICAFNLSRFARRGDTLRIDLFPDVQSAEMEQVLRDRVHVLERTFGRVPTNSEFMCGMSLPRVAEAVIERAALLPDDPCQGDAVAKLAYAVQHLDFIVEGPADVEHAQVQRGGFGVDGIDPCTMQAVNLPRVHVIGEALDVDGPCGGYNLTWAFATGLLAGRAAAGGL